MLCKNNFPLTAKETQQSGSATTKIGHRLLLPKNPPEGCCPKTEIPPSTSTCPVISIHPPQSRPGFYHANVAAEGQDEKGDGSFKEDGPEAPLPERLCVVSPEGQLLCMGLVDSPQHPLPTRVAHDRAPDPLQATHASLAEWPRPGRIHQQPPPMHKSAQIADDRFSPVRFPKVLLAGQEGGEADWHRVRLIVKHFAGKGNNLYLATGEGEAITSMRRLLEVVLCNGTIADHALAPNDILLGAHLEACFSHQGSALCLSIVFLQGPPRSYSPDEVRQRQRGRTYCFTNEYSLARWRLPSKERLEESVAMVNLPLWFPLA